MLQQGWEISWLRTSGSVCTGGGEVTTSIRPFPGMLRWIIHALRQCVFILIIPKFYFSSPKNTPSFPSLKYMVFVHKKK